MKTNWFLAASYANVLPPTGPPVAVYSGVTLCQLVATGHCPLVGVGLNPTTMEVVELRAVTNAAVREFFNCHLTSMGLPRLKFPAFPPSDVSGLAKPMKLYALGILPVTLFE